MKRHHVIHVRDSNGIFGGERVILGLGKTLDRSRFDVSLLCMRRGNVRSDPLIREAEKQGIRVFPLDVRSRFDMSAIRAMRRIFVDNKIDLFHSHDFKSDFYALAASRKLGIRRVATAHGSTRDSLMKRAYLFLDERIVFRFFTHIIAVSEELVEQLKGKGLGANRVSLVENGLDLDSLYSGEPLDLQLPIPAGSRVFSVVGRLFPDKGHRIFIEAFARLRNDYPEAIGLIVGDGPERESIERQVRALGIEKRVLLLGVRSDMGNIYRHSDFLIIPSLREGLPYVLLEAMAMKVPVLATRVGQIPKLVEESKIGCLVPPGDAAALSQGMRQLLEMGREVDTWAEKARLLVEKKYSVESMTRQVEQIYQRVLAAPS